MKLILLRHAIAESREVFAETGKRDEFRPLTSRGRKKFIKTLPFIKNEIGEIDLIISSPLTRTIETAKLIIKEFPKVKLSDNNLLTPGSDPSAMLEWLQQESGQTNVMLIGHEPDLSKLGTYLLTGKKTPIFRLRKGGFCILQFTDHLDKAKAELKCLIQPSTLKNIGK